METGRILRGAMSQRTARLLVFFTSAAVLVIEILAQRLLAPYLGVSLEVFTGVIGVILAGIALGAWQGGKVADRGDDPGRLLGPLLIGGGLAALASPLLVDLAGPILSGGGPISIVLITSIGFLAPAAVLSAIPPVVVKMQLASLEHTGEVVGSYSAVGTAGAILGTFITGFILIAAFPSRPIVMVVGASLIAAGIGFGVNRGVMRNSGLAAVGLIALLLVFNGPCDYETTYHCADVVTDPARPAGRTLVLDGVPNSYVDLEDPTHLEFRYALAMADVIGVMTPQGPLTVVHIGGGGFTFPAYLDALHPGTSHYVLEIDAELFEIGRNELGLSAGTNVIVDDARRSLDKVPRGAAGLVIGDAFSGLSVPWHLTTVEFVRQVKAAMTPTGLYTINIIDYGDLDFVRSETSTLSEVFEHVAVVAPPAYLAGEDGGNFVLVGSDAPIPAGAIQAAIVRRGGSEQVDTEPIGFIDDARPLTDDFAPVDQMIDRP